MNIIASLLAWKVFGPLLKLVVAKIMELYTANTIAGGCKSTKAQMVVI